MYIYIYIYISIHIYIYIYIYIYIHVWLQAQIDWHDFVVCEQIEFTAEDDASEMRAFLRGGLVDMICLWPDSFFCCLCCYVRVRGVEAER